MFDFGFWEMMLILTVALIVVGPERLPGLARAVGLWLGKAKRIVADIKTEIDQELAATELKKALDKNQAGGDVYEVIEETRQAAADIRREIKKPATTGATQREADKANEREATATDKPATDARD